MNLFGKILVALNLVMSLVFMGFAVAVYSTHQNWRDVVDRDPDAKSETTLAGRWIWWGRVRPRSGWRGWWTIWWWWVARHGDSPVLASSIVLLHGAKVTGRMTRFPPTRGGSGAADRHIWQALVMTTDLVPGDDLPLDVLEASVLPEDRFIDRELSWLLALKEWAAYIHRLPACSVPVWVVQGGQDRTVNGIYNVSFIRKNLNLVKMLLLKNASHQLANERDDIRAPIDHLLSEFLKA